MFSFGHLSLQACLLASLLYTASAGIIFDQATCGVAGGSNPIMTDIVNMATAAKVGEVESVRAFTAADL